MPIHLYHRPSFGRSVKQLGYEQRKIVGLILEALDTYYSAGCDLVAGKKIASGFFYKQLRRPFYEAGLENTTRVVIEREGKKGILIMAGNHNQIRKFLADV